MKQNKGQQALRKNDKTDNHNNDTQFNENQGNQCSISEATSRTLLMVDDFSEKRKDWAKM